jgi:outer membrane receptor protein involved in Fe transport
VDLSVDWAAGALSLRAEIRNLLDDRFSTTGFPDPSGSGTRYFYPGAGRTVSVAVSRSW